MKALGFFHQFLDRDPQVNLIGLQSGILALLICYSWLDTGNNQLIMMLFGLMVNSMMLAQNYPGHNSIQRLHFGAVFGLPCAMLYAFANFSSNSLVYSTLTLMFLAPLVVILNGYQLIGSFTFYLVYAYIIGLGFHTNFVHAVINGFYFFLGASLIVIGGYLRVYFRNRFLAKKEHLAYVDYQKVFSIHPHKFAFMLILTGLLTLSNYISLALAIPHGYWLPMTALLVFKNDHQLTLKRIKHRIIGSLIGVALAFLLLLFANKLLLVFLMAALFYLMVITINRHYAMFCVIITLLIIAIIKLTSHESFAVLFVRLGATFAAVIAVAIAALVGKYHSDK